MNDQLLNEAEQFLIDEIFTQIIEFKKCATREQVLSFLKEASPMLEKHLHLKWRRMGDLTI